MMQDLSPRWPGPIVVAVFVTSIEDAQWTNTVLTSASLPGTRRPDTDARRRSSHEFKNRLTFSIFHYAYPNNHTGLWHATKPFLRPRADPLDAQPIPST